MGIAYILLERPGALDARLLGALTQCLDCYAAGVAFAGPGGAFSWVWSEPDGGQRDGQSQGGGISFDYGVISP